jgi:hypothetical protein
VKDEIERELRARIALAGASQKQKAKKVKPGKKDKPAEGAT